MILADTSVIVDFLRSGDARLRHIIVTEPAAICGVTRAEILHGARDSLHQQQLLVALNLFPAVPITDAVWDKVGDNLAALRSKGVTIPFADVIVATVAIEHGLELWTCSPNLRNPSTIIAG
jgi:hypothetical protein